MCHRVLRFATIGLCSRNGVPFFKENNMDRIKRFFKNFTLFEYLLWGGSLIAILLSFFLCGNTDYLNLAGSLVGATSLILIAKGQVAGQVLGILFAAFYGYVSFTFNYYGEMITYLGMTAPMSVATLVSWLKHPFKGERREVEVNMLKKREYLVIAAVTAVVTVAFYFILDALGTNNLMMSTVSVLTSFSAVALTLRRSPYYALCYALNDVVLIVLWTLAAMENSEYIALIVCFCVFLINDLYGLVSWSIMLKRQKNPPRKETDAVAHEAPEK